MPEAQALRDLRDAFIALAARGTSLTAAERAMLRGRVCDAARAMKDSGALGDRAAVVIQAIAVDTRIQRIGEPSLEALIRWCVDKVYAPAPA